MCGALLSDTEILEEVKTDAATGGGAGLVATKPGDQVCQVATVATGGAHHPQPSDRQAAHRALQSGTSGEDM